MTRNVNAESVTEPKGLQDDLASYGVTFTHVHDTIGFRGHSDTGQTKLTDYQ